IRPVAAVAPRVSRAAGISLQALPGALGGRGRPAARLCVDSLCPCGRGRRGRTLQLSDPARGPGQPRSGRHPAAAGPRGPDIAAGTGAAEGRDLVVAARALDSVIARGAALLGAAIHRALQPRLTLNQLCWLANP